MPEGLTAESLSVFAVTLTVVGARGPRTGRLSSARFPSCLEGRLSRLCFCEFKSDVFAMLSDFGGGSGDHRCRDVFPIPLLSVPVLAKPNLSRSVRQRINQDIQSTIRANEAIDCLMLTRTLQL